ncbi:DsbA family protein [Orbus sturtevantii]|uniref:DsbA family protein n=1 Tax=Orbus sturtevantii TaxID=3074109 RepID=UPI00370D822E
MIKKFFIALSAILFSFSIFAAETQTSESVKIEEGKQYIVLAKFPAPEKEVVEFFSFNCPSCFRLDDELKLGKTIKNRLPEGVTFKKYSLSDFGRLAPELSEAWAIANVLGIAEDVSIELYNGIQRDGTIKTANDIKGVFANLGVDNAKYDSMKNNFLVKAFIAQQEAARKELEPTSIPSFYVNGKYLINANGMNSTSSQALLDDYSNTINYLTTLK